MKNVQLAEAKAHLSELVSEVANGEVVTITRHGKAVAKLTPVERDRRPIDLAALRALTSSLQAAERSTVEELRSEARY